MSKRANPTLIGAFVVGAVAIAVAAILVLGGGRVLFADKSTYVMYFQGSVKGLSIGSPVRFRGVDIGNVKDIKLVVTRKRGDRIDIPVIVEIDNTRFLLNPDIEEAESGDDIDKLIKLGLRGQLQLQSLLTGQLFIQIDYYPNTPVQLTEDSMFKGRYEQVPTINTPIEKLARKLEDFPFEAVLDDISTTIKGINKLVNGPDLQHSLASLHVALDKITALVESIDKQVDPLASGVADTLRDASVSLENVNTTMSDAGATLRQARKTLESTENFVTDEKLLTALDNALHEVSAAAYSIRNLAEAINNQPESLIRGRR